MEQLSQSWDTFLTIYFISFGILCVCVQFFDICYAQIGQRHDDSEIEDPILPLRSSSSSSISRAPTLVLRKCASCIIRFLHPSTASAEGKAVYIEDLPSDVLLHIFSFLPLSSLGPLFRVSKMWSDLLRDQNNMDFVLGRRSPNKQNNCPIYLLGRNVCRRFITELYILESSRNSTCSVSVLEVGKLMIINTSCSGFICCSPHSKPSELFLCNPLTREFVKIPDHPKMKADSGRLFKSREFEFQIDMPWHKHSCDLSLFGLGIDPTCKKQSKLVGFHCGNIYDTSTFRKKKNESYTYECNVYTLGSNSWRSVEGPMFAPSGDAVIYNWALYWLVDVYRPEAPILAFDLENEKFRLVPPPPPDIMDGDKPWFFSYVTKLGEELCYVREYCRETRIHVLEDDVKMVWSLRYCLTAWLCSHGVSDFKVYGVWPGDALFGVSDMDNSVIYYSPEDRWFHRLVKGDCPTGFKYVIREYFPSSVSPRLFWSR